MERGSAVHVSNQGRVLIGQIMRDYRVLELRPDGHVTSRFDLSARDDEVAKEQALKAASSRDLQLWRNARKIAEWRGQRPTWPKVRRLAKGA